MAPGNTYMPRSSTTLAPTVDRLFSSRLVMTPSRTCTSTIRGPSGVWTVPPVMTRSPAAPASVKFEVTDAKQRRVLHPCAVDVVLSTLAAVEHNDQVDHVHARVAK